MTVEKKKIRPSARIIRSIGNDLIKDVPAAIVELVKNAYDADAPSVDIIFKVLKDTNTFKIIIKDTGHGMSPDVVENVWLVPATNDKYKRVTSPKGRRLQGRKGLGRYATGVLGNKLTLITVDHGGNKTIVKINWDDFKDDALLSDIDIELENSRTNDLHGTYLEITSDIDSLSEWNQTDVEILIKELRKLLSPLKDGVEDRFDINLEFSNFPVKKYENKKIQIQPYSLVEFYDYRLYGEIDTHGRASLFFENRTVKGIPVEAVKMEKIKLNDDERHRGNVSIDFRVFDRDPEAIDNLLKKGLKTESDKQLSKNEVRNLLTELSGIGVYRGGFRIRPYGDPGYDWLELDKKRVQNPAQKIGSNQIVGFIKIQSEEESNLVEKSARDGLKEDKYFAGLKKIAEVCLMALENRRFSFRVKSGRGRKRAQATEIDGLLDYSDLTSKVQEKLKDYNLNYSQIIEISNMLEEDRKGRVKIIDDIRDLMSMYQGQATLGKIIMVILHEGSAPLSWFRELPNHFEDWVAELEDSNTSEIEKQEVLEIIKDRLEVSQSEAKKLIYLFDKLDPLSSNKRPEKALFNIKKAIQASIKVFESLLDEHGIKVDLYCDSSYNYFGVENDLLVAMTNLIQNSAFWLSHDEKSDKEIAINVLLEDGVYSIDYRDSGPGIEMEFIEQQVIFEPGFTTKPDGTGLGLAIAGEAIDRLSGNLKALYETEGAHFYIELLGGNESERN